MRIPMMFLRWTGSVLLSGFLAVALDARAGVQEEPPIEAPWYLSFGLGGIGYEGDEELEDGLMGVLRLGYDYSDWWTFEGSLALAPSLDENMRFDIYTNKYVSRLEEVAGAGVHDTDAIGAALDALFHFTRWERLDPYLAIGAGLTWYSEDLSAGSVDPVIRAGGGVMYHFNDEWAIRADGRTFFAGEDTEANATIDAGVVWTWGAKVAPKFTAVGGPTDSDRDGLPDSEEIQLGTDPYDPDTDKDELTDGEEVYKYQTDPLNPDTDWDGLMDGAEVKKHTTDPRKRDTDNGGVADGHEVLEDGTDPLVGADDLQLFELNIEFDYDRAEIKPQFFGQLDVIGKVLTRAPSSTARIEGHADKTGKSGALYNNKLSQRRAESVMNHLAERWRIATDRMTAVGYGFSRPKAPNDPKLGNPANRRVEVYIRGAGASEPAAVEPAKLEPVAAEPAKLEPAAVEPLKPEPTSLEADIKELKADIPPDAK